MDYRKIKLVGEEVQGKVRPPPPPPQLQRALSVAAASPLFLPLARHCPLPALSRRAQLLLTNFYGMDMTRDKLCSLMRKWQTLIEASADAKTSDGYSLRLFAIAFTKRRPTQVRKTSYASSSQIRAIRKKMVDIMTAEVAKSDLKSLVQKFVPEAISKEIEKACFNIYPLQVRALLACARAAAPRRRAALRATALASLACTPRRTSLSGRSRRSRRRGLTLCG